MPALVQHTPCVEQVVTPTPKANAPRKSTACPACRKTRRRCDRQKPSCSQCRRARIECPGYGKTWVFMNNVKEQEHESAAEPWKKSASMEPEPLPKTSSRPRERKFINAIQDEINGKPVVLRRCLNWTAYEEIFIDSFWSTYLPVSRPASAKDVAPYNTSDWMHVVRDMYRDNGTLRLAFLANCVALKGFEDDKQWLIEKSRQLYGQALKALAQTIGRPSAPKSDAILATVRMILLFEVCYCESYESAESQSRRWYTHGAGHKAVIYSRGPHHYQSGYAHQLFVGCRLHQSITDATLRRKCFLSTPEWKEIPFSKTGKTPKDELTDVVTEMGGLFEEADSIALLSDPKETLKRVERVSEKAWSLADDLKKWSTGSGRRVIQFINSKLDATTTEPPSNEELIIGDSGMNYLCISLIIHGILKSTASQLPESPRPDQIQPIEFCRKITQFIPFFQAAKAKVWAIHMLSFPIGCALMYLEKEEQTKEILELKESLKETLNGKAGLAIARFLKSLESSEGSVPRI